MSNIFRNVNETLSDEDIKMMNPLSLAFIGDAVFEMFVRTDIMTAGKNAHKLHVDAAKLVNAKAQAKFFFKIKDCLTERELGVINRAKNSKIHTMPRNQDYDDYRFATALEALFGYHYLRNDEERLSELYERGRK